jgi:hypothetical protein
MIQTCFLAPDVEASVGQAVDVADSEGPQAGELVKRVIHRFGLGREMRLMLWIVTAHIESTARRRNSHRNISHAGITPLSSGPNL